MSQRASSVGDLAVNVLARGAHGAHGEVTRVFERSAYVKAGDDFVLLLWGGLRSPITVNLMGPGEKRLKAGERCALNPGRIAFDSWTVEAAGAEVYRSVLLERRDVRVPPASRLVRGVSLLRSLYDALPSGPSLPSDVELRRFALGALTALAAGREDGVRSFESYRPLIGRGGGFTPAGDDFVGGLLSTYNYVARCKGSREILIQLRRLRPRTIPESAALLAYASKGYVDEGIGSLVLKTLGRSPEFTDELIAVARRGHTSGLDMSLGILLVEAALRDSAGRGGALERCLEVLWHQ
jgi:uncharacterized protein DUF2877